MRGLLKRQLPPPSCRNWLYSSMLQRENLCGRWYLRGGGHHHPPCTTPPGTAVTQHRAGPSATSPLAAVTRGTRGTVAAPPRAGTHPVSSMIQPSHESGQRQSPGREDRGWGAGCPTASSVAPQGPLIVPTLLPGVPGTCCRVVLVPHHAHILPQRLHQRHGHERHVAILHGRDGAVTAGIPLSPARSPGGFAAPTSLTPPARVGEQMPPTKAAPLRLL